MKIYERNRIVFNNALPAFAIIDSRVLSSFAVVFEKTKIKKILSRIYPENMILFEKNK